MSFIWPKTLEDADTLSHALAAMFAFYLIIYYGTSVQPLGHPDPSLQFDLHKKAEAERIKVLNRLNGQTRFDDDSQFMVTSDKEQGALDRLVPHASGKAASLATISLSRDGLGAKSGEAMKTLSGSTAWEESVGDSFFCSSRMMQTTVELQDGTLDRLKDLVKNTATPPPNELTPVLQVDNWAVLMPSVDQGVELLRLPTNVLPVILHAEYATGLVIITGLNLEHADIFASSESATSAVQLNVYRFVKASKDGQEDIAVLPLRLACKDTMKVFIYATKKVEVLGQHRKTVDVVSKAVHIVDSFWNTIVGFWIPLTVFSLFAIYEIRALLLDHGPNLPTMVVRHIEAMPDGMSCQLLFTAFLIATIISRSGVANRVLARFLKYCAGLVRAPLVFKFMSLCFPRIATLNGPLIED